MSTISHPVYPGEATLSVGTRVELHELIDDQFTPSSFKVGRVYPVRVDLAGFVWLEGKGGDCLPFTKGKETRPVGFITIRTIKKL